MTRAVRFRASRPTALHSADLSRGAAKHMLHLLESGADAKVSALWDKTKQWSLDVSACMHCAGGYLS